MVDIMAGVRNLVAKHERERAEKLDTEISAWLFDPEPGKFGRVIRTKLIENTGQAFMVPGSMWADGKARLVTGLHTKIDEQAIEWHDA